MRRRLLLLPLAALALSPALAAPTGDTTDSYGDRAMILHVPATLPAPGKRALVIVLHGGMGNADRIAGQQAESGLNMDAVADKGGFVVAYLNGTPVTRLMGAKFLGWNAGGGCCGQPGQNGTDDVGYIGGAVSYLADKYGVDRTKIFAIGHSNGAMMAQRMVCETRVFVGAVAISGPLNLDTTHCPSANGLSVLAIHGGGDRNVPIAGGKGSKGLAQVAWKSEAQSQAVMTASGAHYTLQIVPGADHFLDHIGARIEQAEGVSIGEKAARAFGIGGTR
ncbi:MAG: prolyl oligopeptidase family serine peptidase [Pseudomonadota bacterium]